MIVAGWRAGGRADLLPGLTGRLRAPPPHTTHRRYAVADFDRAVELGYSKAAKRRDSLRAMLDAQTPTTPTRVRKPELQPSASTCSTIYAPAANGEGHGPRSVAHACLSVHTEAGTETTQAPVNIRS